MDAHACQRWLWGVMLLTAASALRAAPAEPPAGSGLLVTDMELVDFAPPDQQYDHAADRARLAMLSRRIRAAIVVSKRFHVVGARHPPYRYVDCHQCVVDWAHRQGAAWLLVGWVQKESRLILIVDLQLIDLAHPSHSRNASVELRGDTDATWQAGANQVLQRLMGVTLAP